MQDAKKEDNDMYGDRWYLNLEDSKKLVIQQSDFFEYSTSLGLINPTIVPGIPSWPLAEKTDGPDSQIITKAKPHIIESLAHGPFKTKRATLERSTWASWGIDTIHSSTPDYILGVKSEEIYQFYVTLPEYHIDGYVPLFVGIIEGTKCVIPESWLSENDREKLSYFYGHELKILGAQLFDLSSPVRKVFMNKINNELKLTHSLFRILLWLKKYSPTLLQEPNASQKVDKITELAEQSAAEYECDSSQTVWNPRLFLHEVLIQALNYHDFKVLTIRRMLYNSLEILNQKSFNKARKKEEIDNDAIVREKITLWLPLAEMLRVKSKLTKSTFIDLLPIDLRQLVVRCIAKSYADQATSKCANSEANKLSRNLHQAS